MLALGLSQELLRLTAAFALGTIIGWEREAVGKDAGIRTAMLVSGGAALYTMISLLMPSVMEIDMTKYPILSDRVVSTIVGGIGFIGGGIIVKANGHARGLTTAATVWYTAAIGILVGIGAIAFAAIATIFSTSMLYAMRKLKLYEHIRPEQKIEPENGN